MTDSKLLAWSLMLCSFGAGALAVAQSNGPAAMASEHCPAKIAAELSDIKVELTKSGATLRLTARRRQDVSTVQESAQQIAAVLSSGECLVDPEHSCMKNQPKPERERANDAP